jgi:aryl-alcohol dehydrogenase-like predicted oxidoreductase
MMETVMTGHVNRRDFMVKTAAATTAVMAAASDPASGAAPGLSSRSRLTLPKSPTELVSLGKTGIQVSLIGMGTGSVGNGGASNQTRLGLQGFKRVVRYALDHGIRFFDVADQYGSHVYLREALKGVPRDQYVIQTKSHATNLADARSHLERYRLELGVDYIDIVLLHCMQKTAWPHDHQGSMEYLMKAKEEKIIRAHGTSCHGMDPLRTSAKNPFVEVDLARINPEGKVMDDKKPDEVASVLEEMHVAGKGVVGMKILGEGQINTPERKDASLRYVLGLGTVNAFIIGFQATDQVDDILKRTGDAITFLKG